MSYAHAKSTSLIVAGVLLTTMFLTAGTGAAPPPGLEQTRAFARQLLVRKQYPNALAAYLTITQQVPEGKALQRLERTASAGHLSAIDAMRRGYIDGLYLQPPDAAGTVIG